MHWFFCRFAAAGRREQRLFIPVLFLTILLCISGCGDSEGKDHPYLAKAELLRSQGDFKGAEEYYRRFLEKYPRSRTGLASAGAFYSECAGDMEKAIGCYRAALEVEHSDLLESSLQAVRKADFEKKSEMFHLPSNRQKNSNIASVIRSRNAFAAQNTTLRRMISRQNRQVNELSVRAEKAEKNFAAASAKLRLTEKQNIELKRMIAGLNRKLTEARNTPAETAEKAVAAEKVLPEDNAVEAVEKQSEKAGEAVNKLSENAAAVEKNVNGDTRDGAGKDTGVNENSGNPAAEKESVSSSAGNQTLEERKNVPEN